MGKRKTHEEGFWLEELKFIETSDPVSRLFNRDPESFKRYVAIQAKFAAEDGFDDVSEKMKGIIDGAGSGKRA